MKNFIFLLIVLIIPLTTNAARTCDDYITDEWPSSRYIIENIFSDNIVTDNVTDLMWKQCAEGLTGNDCLGGVLTMHTWIQALEKSVIQNASGFAGFNDWRLPNIEELRSIMTFNCYNPAINEMAFPNTSSLFWSSSPNAKYPSKSWSINTFGGHSIGNNRDAALKVRLVRFKK